MIVTKTGLHIRLRPFRPEDLAQARLWYSDAYVLSGVISPDQKEPLTDEILTSMYRDLQSRGSLFIIEVQEDEGWTAIGDVTLAQNAFPIVIGDSRFRGQNVAKSVVQFLISQAKQKGWSQLSLKGIL